MAAGFALTEHSASGLGNAYAGAAAVAEDPSTVWFNPAGMTLLHGRQITGSLNVIVPSIEFHNQSSTLSPLVGGGPISGGDDGDAGGPVPVPSLYYVQPLNERFTFGLGINAPFGLVTDYDDDWVGRYHAIKTDLLTINFNPNIAWKVNDNVALAVGFDALYLHTELSSAVDQSSACLGALGAACTSIGLGTPGNRAADGKAVIKGDDWGYGFNLGALFNIGERLRIGASYRSSIDTDVEGDADFQDINPAFASFNVFSDTGASAGVDLPASLSLSGLYQVTDRWSLLGDVTWTDWSQFNELRVKFDNPNQPDSVTTESWNDSYRYSLGVGYQPNERWTYRFGVAYDETPVPDKEHRTPRLPDDNRLWLALGLGYAPWADLRLDLGYAHLFIDDPQIDNTLESPSPTHTIRGKYQVEANILGGQLNWKF